VCHRCGVTVGEKKVGLRWYGAPEEEPTRQPKWYKELPQLKITVSGCLLRGMNTPDFLLLCPDCFAAAQGTDAG
jgi:hypothetical protein